MTSTQVIKTSVTTCNSHCQDYTNLNDQTATNIGSTEYRSFAILGTLVPLDFKYLSCMVIVLEIVNGRCYS